MARREPEQAPEGPPPEETYDPSNPFIQAMLVFALLACIGTIVMIGIQLNEQYDVTFGGMLNKPDQQQQQQEPQPDQQKQQSSKSTSSSSKK